MLLQLQMLLLVCSDVAEVGAFEISCDFGGFDDEDAPLDTTLRICHLANITSEFQLQLGLDETNRS